MNDPTDPNLTELLEEALQSDGSVAELPDALPVLPLRGTVLFPGVVMPLLVTRPAALELVEAVRAGERVFRRGSHEGRQP